jgi:hypothetical protein
MSANRNVTATFDITPPFCLYISEKCTYPAQTSLQNFYDTSPDNAIIQMQSTIPDSTEKKLSAALAKTITLMGGYDADFKLPAGEPFTIIQGKVEVNNGTLKVQRVKVQ